MTGPDRDWQDLAGVWTGGEAVSPDRVAALLRATRRQHLRLRLTVAFELGLTAVMLGLLVILWAQAPGPRMTALGSFALIHTAVVWALVLWNRRGRWSGAVAGTVRQALAAREAHFDRRRRVLGAMRRLVVVELVGLPGLVWAVERLAPAEAPRTVVAMLTAAAIPAGILVWIRWEEGRIARRQAELRTLARDLELDR